MNEDEKQTILVSLQGVASALNSLVGDITDGRVDASEITRRRGLLADMLMAEVAANDLGDVVALVPLTKAQAIEKWGAEVVDLARDYYETNFDKYLFQEDIPEGDEFGSPASVEDVYERCERASRNLKASQTFSRPHP